MDILTFPIGIVAGMLPVVANLGGPGAPPAEVLLDGRPACVLVAEAPTCTVDLGRDPQMHVLELVRRDAAGHIAERTVRWVNRPGAEAEVFLRAECKSGARRCDLSIGWGHPGKLDPRSMRITVDGATESSEVVHRLKVPAPPTDRAHVVSVDLIFPDGRRATQTTVLGAAYLGAAEGALQAVPVLFDRPLKGGTPPLAALGDVPVQALEDAPEELAFVVEPLALRAFSSLWVKNTAEPRAPGRRLLDLLGQGGHMTAVVPNERLGRFGVFQRPSERDIWLSKLAYDSDVLEGGDMRLADAVAAAGMLVAGGPRKRAVVLVVSGRHEDQSRFTPEQVTRFLAEIMVPLHVWRVEPGAGAGWPDGPVVTIMTLLDATRQVRATLDAQRIAWVDARVERGRLLRVGRQGGVEVAGLSLVAPRLVYSGTPEGGPELK